MTIDRAPATLGSIQLLTFARNSRVVFRLFVAFIILVTAVAIPLAPVAAWGLVAILLGVSCVGLPIHTWVATAVLAAGLSRLFVASGLVPASLNFVHFPLALGAALLAATRRTPPRRLALSLGLGLAALLLVSLLSWICNGGEILRPLLTWLLFSEPFLLVFALVSAPPSPVAARRLWTLALVLALSQVPLAVSQSLMFSVGDLVRGTFTGEIGGAHTAGSVALIGALMCMARWMDRPPGSRPGTGWHLAAAGLFLVPVLADAKQAIMAFIPALVPLSSLFSWRRPARVLAPLLLPLVLLVAGVGLNPQMRQTTDWNLAWRGLGGKLHALRVVVPRMLDTPSGLLLGLGPGNTVSRVALLSRGGHVREDSPVYFLELRLSPVTEELLPRKQTEWLWRKSSPWSPISSWIGLFGDLGLIGFGIYLWMAWRLWRGLPQRHAWGVQVAKGCMVMAGLLGLVYSWLEEPGFTLLVATVIGLALSTRRESAIDFNHLDTT